jgi:hypothetical protein
MKTFSDYLQIIIPFKILGLIIPFIILGLIIPLRKTISPYLILYLLSVLYYS